MKADFITLYGKVSIDKKRLFIRTVEIPFSKLAITHLLFEFGFITIFVLQFFDNDDNPAKKYLHIGMWGLLLLFRLPKIHYLVFKRSYSNLVNLKNVKSVSTEHQYSGLNTILTLHLSNGRERKIIFRTLENQYQPFTEIIEQHIAQPQPA